MDQKASQVGSVSVLSITRCDHAAKLGCALPRSRTFLLIAVLSLSILVLTLGLSFLVDLLFQKVTDEDSVINLSDNDCRGISRAVMTYNALGLYLANEYVRERDVMDMGSVYMQSLDCSRTFHSPALRLTRTWGWRHRLSDVFERDRDEVVGPGCAAGNGRDAAG
jgi:hypothetical protein